MIQKLIFYYLIFINIFTFIAFALDKFFAIKNLSRVSEKKLHTLSFIGGVAGASLAMVIFRHKVNKKEFYLKEFFIIFLWLIWSVLYFLYIKRLNFLDIF